MNIWIIEVKMGATWCVVSNRMYVSPDNALKAARRFRRKFGSPAVRVARYTFAGELV